MSIYDRIKQLRIDKGMSQLDLALAVGYKGRSAISKVEKGERDISQSMVIKYAQALGVTPNYLMSGEEATEKSEIKDDNGHDSEFLELFLQLTDEQQRLIISQIKGILSNE